MELTIPLLLLGVFSFPWSYLKLFIKFLRRAKKTRAFIEINNSFVFAWSFFHCLELFEIVLKIYKMRQKIFAFAFTRSFFNFSELFQIVYKIFKMRQKSGAFLEIDNSFAFTWSFFHCLEFFEIVYKIFKTRQKNLEHLSKLTIVLFFPRSFQFIIYLVADDNSVEVKTILLLLHRVKCIILENHVFCIVQ